MMSVLSLSSLNMPEITWSFYSLTEINFIYFLLQITFYFIDWQRSHGRDYASLLLLQTCLWKNITVLKFWEGRAAEPW